MKMERLLPAVVLGAAAVAAHGQAAVYFNPIVTRVANSQVDNGTFSYLGQNNTSALRGGVSIGSYYNFSHGAKADIGADVRDEWQRGTNSLLNSFLLGLRVSGKATDRLRPYAELLGGVGTTRAPFTGVRTSKGEFKVYGGLDYRITPHLDFRAVEIGYGTLTTANSSLYNSSTSYPSSSLLSFSSGLVVRFGASPKQ